MFFHTNYSYCPSAINNALKQGNLSPELEEKLVNMRKQQQDQQDDWELSSRGSATDDGLTPSRRRTISRQQNDDTEWKVRGPSRRPNAITTSNQFNRTIKKSRRQTEEVSDLAEPKHTQLDRHKEMLKKTILRKRSLLERNLQNEIRDEVQTKVQRHVRPMSVASPDEHSENERSFSDRRSESNLDLKRYLLVASISCSISITKLYSQVRAKCPKQQAWSGQAQEDDKKKGEIVLRLPHAIR